MNIDLIKRAINSFYWEKAFSNNDVGKMVSIFNQAFVNILCNFIPHETVLNDRDPPWMNKQLKKLIHEKKKNFNCFHRNNNTKQLLDRLKDLQTQLNFLI